MLKLRNYLLLSLFVRLIHPLMAQNIFLSDVFPLKINDNIDIISQQSGYNYFIQSSGNGYQVHRLDAELKNLRTILLPLNERKSEVVFSGFVNKNLNIVYKYRIRSELCFKIMIYDVDLNLKDSTTLTCFPNSVYNPQIQVIPSEDKNSLLVYYSHLSDYSQFLSFDLGSKKLNWSYKWDHILEKTEFRFLEKVLFDNHGNAILVFNDQIAVKNKYAIGCAYLTKNGVIRKTFFDLPFNVYESDWFVDNKNQKLLLVGTYSNDKGRKANGSLYCSSSIPFTNDSLYYCMNPFTPGLIGAYLNEKEKPEKGIDDFYIPNAILKQEGGVVFIIEKNKKIERYISGRSTNFGGVGRNIIDHYYDDLLVISLSKSGIIEWMAPLAKKQFSQDDDGDFSSFLLIKGSNLLRILFNDEIKNENTISQYIVRSDGSYERKSLLNTDYRKLKIMFRQGKQVSSNACLIPCLSRNKLKFLKIEF